MESVLDASNIDPIDDTYKSGSESNSTEQWIADTFETLTLLVRNETHAIHPEVTELIENALAIMVYMVHMGLCKTQQEVEKLKAENKAYLEWVARLEAQIEEQKSVICMLRS